MMRTDIRNKLFFSIVPVLTVVVMAVVHWLQPVQWDILLVAFIGAALTNLSITAGYHRLFSHRTYEANTFLRVMFLIGGTAAVQGSALEWSSDHRVHHNKIDSEDDPYAITKGFWYAHMGWLFDRQNTERHIHAPDLAKDPWIQFQHKNYHILVVLIGFVIPAIIGWMMGSFWQGLIWIGAMRVLVSQQTTFFVNSLCHYFGSRPYSLSISARDNLLVSWLTHGEGYHNYHHRFQTDYRNGVRWYHWDPTKWTIRLLSWVGLAKNLRAVSKFEIQKAQLQVEELRLKAKGVSEDRVRQLKEHILRAQEQLKTYSKELESLRLAKQDAWNKKFEEIRLEYQFAQVELNAYLKQWKLLLRTAGAY